MVCLSLAKLRLCDENAQSALGVAAAAPVAVAKAHLLNLELDFFSFSGPPSSACPNVILIPPVQNIAFHHHKTRPPVSPTPTGV